MVLSKIALKNNEIQKNIIDLNIHNKISSNFVPRTRKQSILEIGDNIPKTCIMIYQLYYQRSMLLLIN